MLVDFFYKLSVKSMSYSNTYTNQDIYINMISCSAHYDTNNKYFMLEELAESMPASLYWRV